MNDAFHLGTIDPEIDALLKKRDGLIESFKNPISRAQLILRQIAEGGAANSLATEGKASDLPSLAAAIEDALAKLNKMSHEQKRLEISLENSNIADNVQATSQLLAKLKSLSKSSLADPELQRLVPAQFTKLSGQRQKTQEVLNSQN